MGIAHRLHRVGIAIVERYSGAMCYAAWFTGRRKLLQIVILSPS